MVYLDWNATTPLCEEAALAMQRAIAEGAWGNPASVHAAGRRARFHVENARGAVAKLAAVDPRDVVLTSGGTEANNLALYAPFHEPDKALGGLLVVGSIEHPSVLRAALALRARGVEVVVVEPGEDGAYVPQKIADELARPRSSPNAARLVTMQAINHETGVIQPVQQVAALAREAGALFHCDAVQAVGRLDPAQWRGADLLTIASHKLRGPKGVGALASLCNAVKLHPLLRGGEQERGVRPGTQDPIACAGFAAAATHAATGHLRYASLRALRDQLEQELAALGAVVNGTGPRAPHVSNVSFQGWSGPELCAALDLEGVCVSSGSACSAGTADPSPVITAIAGLERARQAVRISMGEGTTQAELNAALEAFRRVLLRGKIQAATNLQVT